MKSDKYKVDDIAKGEKNYCEFRTQYFNCRILMGYSQGEQELQRNLNFILQFNCYN